MLYHRIVNKQSKIGKHKIFVWEKDFEKQLQYLQVNQYQAISFYDLQQNPKMDLNKKVILTFDDGYQDNYFLLFPLLKKYNFKAVIYLVTGTNYNKWGVVENEPSLPLMTAEQLKELSDYGIEMGGHTRNHVDLSKCSAQEQVNEIKGCKEDVEKIIGKEIVSFAYPFGGINESAKQVTKESGFVYAVSTSTGPKEFGEDLFQIRRIEITSKTPLFSFKNKVSGAYFNANLFQNLFRGKQNK